MSESTINVKAYTGAVTNTVVDVDSTNCAFLMIDIGNTNASVVYVQVFNRAAANVTLGTTNPLLTIEVPASSGRVFTCGRRVNLGGDGFSIAATAGRSNATSPGATAVDVNVLR